MIIIIRLGGSVIASPPNPVLIDQYAILLKDLSRQGHRIVVVVGGGTLARDFIALAQQLGLDEPSQDWAAIYVSRLVAHLFVLRLEERGYRTVPESLDAVVAGLKQGGIVVMGGLQPGMTTDTVAAMVGEQIKADLLVKATNVDGVFTQDPKKYPEAKKLEEIQFKDLDQFFEVNQHQVGLHQVLDPEAIKILQKGRMKMVIVNGFVPQNVLLAVKGERVGTLLH